MMMPHPLIPVSLPPASVTMAMSQMNHLSTIANMAAAAQGQSAPSRMVTSVIKVTHGAVLSLCRAHLSSAIGGRWRGVWVVRDPCFHTALQGAVCQTIAWERKQGKEAERRSGVGGMGLLKKTQTLLRPWQRGSASLKRAGERVM